MRLIAIILLSFSYTKTSIDVQLSDTNYSIGTDLEFDNVEVFPIGHPIPDDYGIIQEVFIGPYGSSSCDYESVLYRVKEKTIELNGNAFKVINVKYPNSGNTCYTITALVLKSVK